MTLLELQQILGERIEIINDVAIGEDEREKEIEKSEIICKIAKQMINNADVILRHDKLKSESKLVDSNITKVVGGNAKN